MTGKKKPFELLKYINTPMGRENIQILYTTHNITYEKCELYNDFIQSLTLLIFDTYMGDDITNNVEQKNHFKWCWETNVNNFSKEGIIINDTKIYKYFLTFMLDVYYNINKNDEDNIKKNILKLWNHIFDYYNNKSKSDVDTLIEVYKSFESSIKVK
jgi:hypothetical protein